MAAATQPASVSGNNLQMTAQTLGNWLTSFGLTDLRSIDLASDSSLILAQAPPC